MNQEEIEQMMQTRRFLRPGERPSDMMRNGSKPMTRPLTPQQIEAMFREQQPRYSSDSPLVQYQPQYISSSRGQEEEEEEEVDEDEDVEQSGTDRDTDQDDDDDDNNRGEKLQPQPKKTRMDQEEEEETRFVDLNLYDDQELDLLPASFLIPEKEQWMILLNAVKSNFYRVANMERVSNKLVALVADAASLSKEMPLNVVQMVAYARQRQV